MTDQERQFDLGGYEHNDFSGYTPTGYVMRTALYFYEDEDGVIRDTTYFDERSLVGPRAIPVKVDVTDLWGPSVNWVLESEDFRAMLSDIFDHDPDTDDPDYSDDSDTRRSLLSKVIELEEFMRENTSPLLDPRADSVLLDYAREDVDEFLRDNPDGDFDEFIDEYYADLEDLGVEGGFDYDGVYEYLQGVREDALSDLEYERELAGEDE